MKKIYKISGDNYSQRNNELIWPGNLFPNSQIKVNWTNMCNVTAMCNGLELAGWKFPPGKHKQPEDNLGNYILSSKEILENYRSKLPAMYSLYIKALEGKCSEQEIKNVYTPIEILALLSLGTNKWLNSSNATTFFDGTENVKKFKEVIKENLVDDSLPVVVTTDFGGFGHIVCVVGAIYKEGDFLTPLSLLVDDPWGRVNIQTNKYPSGGGGSGKEIEIPWQFVLKHFKPLNSEKKHYFQLKHGVAIV